MTNNDIAIKELLEAQEGEHYQFKEAKNRFDFTEAAKCCCALSNCGGGKFVLGITDKRPRKVVGSAAFEQPERTRMALIDKLKIMVSFEILHDKSESRVLVFTVAARPIGLPVQVDGTAWYYEGDSLIPMPENVRHRIYQESGVDFSGTICVGATIADLDESAIETFRSKWVEKSGNKRLQTFTREQLLSDCGAMTNEGITYAALILFGKSDSLRKYLPQAEIVFEYRSSNASGPAAQREEFREGFFLCFDRIWNLINLRNDKQHYQQGFFVFDIATFNERVIREVILNAVSHRNYQMGGSIFIRQFRERLTVESPGGFPEGITVDNFLNRQSPRNRRIAEILALCGLVERSGQGMNLIYELSIREAKQLPDFTGTDDYWVFITLNGLILDERMLALLNKIGAENLEAFSTNDFIVINEVFHERAVPSAFADSLKKLVDLGIIEHLGRNKYLIARSFYEVIGKAGTHTRLAGLDRDTNKELLLKHIRKNGDKGTKFSEFEQVLPNLSINQIRVLIRELRISGSIYSNGSTKSTRWYATKN